MAPLYDLDDDEWQDMPVIPPSNSNNANKTSSKLSNRFDDDMLDADEDEDDEPRRALQKRRQRQHQHQQHQQVGNTPRKPSLTAPSTANLSPTSTRQPVGNATGKLIDTDSRGATWREKDDMMDKQDEMDYTRLDLDDDPQEDEISMRTQYLFNEDKGMTPLSQMQATKTLLTEGQRIAYVGLCKLVSREMIQMYAIAAKGAPELVNARESAKAWAIKIMGRLYRHMEVDTAGELKK